MLSELALALSARTPVLVFCGELSAAAASVAQTQLVQELTGISSAPYGALLLEAWRGREPETRALIAMTDREANSRREGIGVAISEYARAVLCNGLGQYEEAFVAASSASEHEEIVGENWGLSELIEPATRTGRTELATDALDRLARKASATRTDWALGIEARSRALLTAKTMMPRACSTRRSSIWVGHGCVRSSPAHTCCMASGCGGRIAASTPARLSVPRTSSSRRWAWRRSPNAPGNELLATGETVRLRSVETRDDLTAQERHIAQLASDGLSNPEIGARLFLSPRTVEWHLRKVFTKLGIRSRQQLASSLPAEVLAT